MITFHFERGNITLIYFQSLENFVRTDSRFSTSNGNYLNIKPVLSSQTAVVISSEYIVNNTNNTF